MATIRLVANDTQPPLLATLTDSVTGLPFDLTSSDRVVHFQFRSKSSMTQLFTVVADKIPGGEAAGQVSVTWPASALVRAAGYYKGRFYVTWTGHEWSMTDELTFRILADYA